MKSIVVCMLAGTLSLAAMAVSAKTVTVPAKDNDRVVAGVSGAAPGKDKASNAATQDSNAAQPSKKALKASKVRTPPPMHDPN